MLACLVIAGVHFIVAETAVKTKITIRCDDGYVYEAKNVSIEDLNVVEICDGRNAKE